MIQIHWSQGCKVGDDVQADISDGDDLVKGWFKELTNLFNLLQGIDRDHGKKHETLNLIQEIFVPVLEVEGGDFGEELCDKIHS